MHICNVKLYAQTTIGHTEYSLGAFEYGEKPSAHKPRCTLRGSAAKDS